MCSITSVHVFIHVFCIQDAQGSPKTSKSGKATASEQNTKELANEAAAPKDDEMATAGEASKRTTQKDDKDAEGVGKGTKRAAEDEASAEQVAASLTVAPTAKRQKTDAEWSKQSQPYLLSQCINVSYLFRPSRGLLLDHCCFYESTSHK